MIRFRLPLLPMLFTALLGSALAPPVSAQEAPSSPATELPSPARPWSSLTPTEREMLAPLYEKWDTLAPRRQAHLIERAGHWATLPPARREEIRQRIAHWQQMTPAERRQARENMRKFRLLTPQQREQLHATFERFQKLPPAQREKLIREWRALPPAERLHWDEQRNHDRPPPPSGSVPTSHDPPSRIGRHGPV